MDEIRVPKDAKEVGGMVGGGSISAREEIAFAFKISGAAEWFKCQHTLLHKIVSSLQAYGQIALNERSGRPAGTDLNEIVQPYQVRDLRTGRDGTSVAIQFATVEGIPLTLTMNHSLARGLIRMVQDELKKGKPDSRHH